MLLSTAGWGHTPRRRAACGDGNFFVKDPNLFFLMTNRPARSVLAQEDMLTDEDGESRMASQVVVSCAAKNLHNSSYKRLS